ARALERPPAKATRVAMLRAKLDRTRERSHPPRLPAGMARRTEAAAIVSQVTDPAQHPFVSHASRNTASIQPFQQRHHDTSRTSQRLAQLTYCGGSVFGNEFGHLRLHALKTLAQ